MSGPTRWERFLRRVRDLAQREMHEAWMDRCRHDRKCPNCKRWFGDAGGWDSLEYETALIERITCGVCEYTSRWWCGDLMPTPIKPAAIAKAQPSPSDTGAKG